MNRTDPDEPAGDDGAAHRGATELPATVEREEETHGGTRADAERGGTARAAADSTSAGASDPSETIRLPETGDSTARRGGSDLSLVVATVLILALPLFVPAAFDVLDRFEVRTLFASIVALRASRMYRELRRALRGSTIPSDATAERVGFDARRARLIGAGWGLGIALTLPVAYAVLLEGHAFGVAIGATMGIGWFLHLPAVLRLEAAETGGSPERPIAGFRRGLAGLGLDIGAAAALFASVRIGPGPTALVAGLAVGALAAAGLGVGLERRD